AGSFDDADAQRSQGGAELLCAPHVERINAHTKFLELVLRGLRREAEARPVGVDDACGGTGARDDKAALDNPLDGFTDRVGRKIPLELANELLKVLSSRSYRRREHAIELAVQKKLAVLGVEAHDIGGQHIDSEIRRKPRNVLAAVL